MATNPEREAASDAEEPTATDRYRQRVGGGRGRRREEAEQDLWVGSYSPRAMIDIWAICGVVTIAALVLGGLYLEGRFWPWLLIALALVWILPALALAYRRMAISYRLTNQRFFHERGILKRSIDRIELIRIDDISYEQRLLERLITGTGTIHIDSSDRSDPHFVMPGVENVREVFAKMDQARRAERNEHGVQVNAV